MTVWLAIERFAWACGVVGLVAYAAASVGGSVGARQELARFEAAKADALRAEANPPGEPPDQRLWSPERVRAWQEARTQQEPAPLAVLRIPHIGLEVPVLEGTDDWTLNRAVGHIADTPRPGEEGNIGVAGHRDGFFRGLKDVGVGERLELETVRGIEIYRIEQTWIVTPQDVWVLDPTPSRAVTLVTCYPFYFIGSAPQRYIVRAVRTESKATS
jgi:sortase A